MCPTCFPVLIPAASAADPHFNFSFSRLFISIHTVQSFYSPSHHRIPQTDVHCLDVFLLRGREVARRRPPPRSRRHFLPIKRRLVKVTREFSTAALFALRASPVIISFSIYSSAHETENGVGPVGVGGRSNAVTSKGPGVGRGTTMLILWKRTSSENKPVESLLLSLLDREIVSFAQPYLAAFAIWHFYKIRW